MEAVITLKNYRCFTDEEPLKIILKKGLIALIGPNNSGKSAFLKFFYEFRGVWSQLSNIDHLPGFAKDGFGASFNQVLDNDSLFSDSNDRPLHISIKINPDNIDHKNALSSIELVSKARSSNNFSLTLFWGKDYKEVIWDLNNVRTEGYFIKNLTSPSNLDCKFFSDFLSILSRCIYIGAFRNIITVGKADYYDLKVGTSFIDAWHEWKAGSIKKNNRVAQDVTDRIQDIFGFKYFEITSGKSNTAFQVAINKNPYKIDEVGSGLVQFIIVFMNCAIASPSFILIDEPELNLHPSLQVKFMNSLDSLASEGVIFATHSVGLARTVSSQIYSFNKTRHNSSVKLFEPSPKLSEFLGEMSFSSYQDLGFSKILLVEGTTDVLTIQQFLRKLKKDQEIVLMPLGGGQLKNKNIEVELIELKRITPDIYCLVESERDSENKDLTKDLKDFSNACEKQGVKYCVTKLRAIENYFSERAIKKVLGNKCPPLEPFEKPKRKEFGWHKSKNWVIANAMEWHEIEDTDVGKFLESL